MIGRYVVMYLSILQCLVDKSAFMQTFVLKFIAGSAVSMQTFMLRG